MRVNREKEKDVNIHDGNSGRVCVNIFGTTCSSAQSCPTVCNPMEYSPPGSSVDGISEARNMEWVATSSSGDLPNPEIKPASPVSHAWQVDSLPLRHQGSPVLGTAYNKESRDN